MPDEDEEGSGGGGGIGGVGVDANDMEAGAGDGGDGDGGGGGGGGGGNLHKEHGSQLKGSQQNLYPDINVIPPSRSRSPSASEWRRREV